MKKIFLVIVCLCVCFIFPLSAFAQPLGYIYKSDIEAYENYLRIPSYNYAGKMVVFARDLENYGYDVIWNGDSRTVEIKKNNEKKLAPIPPGYLGDEEVGTVLHEIYETNIKIYFNGKEIPAYTIGGKTVIYLRSIDALGDIEFDEKERKALLFSRKLNLSTKQIEHIEYIYDILDEMCVVEHALENAEKMAIEGEYNKEVMKNLNNASDKFSNMLDEFSQYSEPDIFSESTTEIWWSMINLDFAITTMKSSWNIFGGEEAEKYRQYILDFSEQRAKALELLSAEF